MGLIYYVGSLVYILVLLILFLTRKRKYQSSLYVAMYLVIAFSTMGYLFVAISRNADEALLSTKVSYFGGQFLPPIMLLILSKFIKFKHHNILLAITVLLGVTFFGITTFGIGFTDLYYAKVEFGTYMGVSYLAKTYGPLHYFGDAYFILFIIIMLVFLISSFRRPKEVSYKNSMLLVALVSVVAILQFFSSSIHPAFDLIPMAYVIAGTLVYIFAQRTYQYDIDAVSNIALKNKEVYGCMGFDYSLNYIGCNKSASEVFPELTSMKIDHPIPDDEEHKKLKSLLIHMKEHSTQHEYHIKKNNKDYKFTVQLSNNKNGFNGFIVEITDDTESVELMTLLKDYNAQLNEEVKEQTEKNVAMQETLLVNLADTINTRDESTGGHVRRTSHLIAIFVKALKTNNVYEKDDDFYDMVRRAAPMHDLGKLSISEEILNKPGRFTPEEYEIMKSHSVIGEKYVEAICKGVEDETFLNIAKNVARYHHEKYQGGGYPDNISGEDIPVEARIMAVADVYDALVSKRVYKERMPFDVANKIMTESFGPHFDPKMQPIYESSREDLENYYKEFDK